MLSPPPLSFPQNLTNEQREVVLLAGYGKQSADIATEIGISVKECGKAPKRFKGPFERKNHRASRDESDNSQSNINSTEFRC